ncbi:cysteine-rich, acidic integral membrane protein-like [Saccostrea echinata]|uniref:cysteine-rich, acidic integral membrane protein-like n=1 Tax=Saccostrea echinata TaxID=191078 RepID=UPI002A82E151|nr:cysteine-rich, acidic integral membrane protein-like [Saccostrea echinata]
MAVKTFRLAFGAEYNGCPSLAREVPSICEDFQYSKYCPDSCRSHQLTCNNCHDIHDPGLCTKTATCQPSESCVITAAFDSSFRITYRQGCFPKQNCSLFVHDNVSGRRNTVLPGDCCYTSRCNHYKPETVNKTSLTCYSCSETTHPSDCKVTTQCHPHQLCVVTQALNADFKMVYRLGCMDRHQCDAFRHDGLGNRRSIVARGDCCEHDRCNSYSPVEITSPTFNSKDCEDVDSHACHALRHVNHTDRCQDAHYANVFCPKTCHTCFHCYNCFISSKVQDLNLCPRSNYTVCRRNSQSCGVEIFNEISMMTCFNDTFCADADDIHKRCCKHNFCNTMGSLTTTTTTQMTSTTITTQMTSTTELTTFGFITIPHNQATTTPFHWATLGTPPHSTQWVTLPWSGQGQSPPSRK